MAVSTWTDQRGRTWRSIPATAAERYVLAADIGQSVDPSALAVIHHHRTPLDTWTVKEGPRQGTTKQDVAERFDVVHLERLLGVPYPEQVGYIADVLNRPPLRGTAELVIDQTGVGAPVGDLFEAAGLAPVRITITAGAEPMQHGHNRWSVPKAMLVSIVDAKLHCGELRFAEALTDAGALREELRDFRRMVTAAGRATFSARVGAHDDLVLAVALATWRLANRNERTMSLGHELKGFYA